MSTLSALATISGLTFLAYGCLCIFSSHMQSEFERYQLSKFRKPVGILEGLGGLGVLLGQLWLPLLIFSAAGLTLLMTCGIIVRLKLRDSVLQIAPAAILLILNAFLVSIGIR